ncbi:DUF192 domain-containing protein [Streptomyces griseocarneus]|uniref:DUF192 domain-containing protein n=1 Tax=Streptomyces griseocarneus TaxID=51201 RepID=UPI00167EF294|nr:DUF192 domain-containing protein [Streptomyces griseocarneus]MBZ6476560.1 DUF192 domain-containing protein [Streptomyces griseocarneus]GHG79711.1 hypothetical protein GCM10018779_60690 [Streptomyces griseocarneus]
MTLRQDGPGQLRVTASGLTVPLEIAASFRARSRGLLGRDAIEGALLLTPASGVHTWRMRFPIDVAYLDRDLTVLSVRTMRPSRLGAPRPRARHVLESAAGAMAQWGVHSGVRVEILPRGER